MGILAVTGLLITLLVGWSQACLSTCAINGASAQACAQCNQNQPVLLPQELETGYTTYQSTITNGFDSNCCATKRFDCSGLDASYYFNEELPASNSTAEVFGQSDCNDFPDNNGNHLHACTAVLTCDANSTWSYYSTLHDATVAGITTIVCSKSTPN